MDHLVKDVEIEESKLHRKLSVILIVIQGAEYNWKKQKKTKINK